MKKFVLFMLAIGFAVVSIGQNQMTKKKSVKRVMDGQEVAISQTIPTPILNLDAPKGEVNRVEVGTCSHQRPFRRDETRIIAYNAELDVISVSFLLDPDTYPEASEAGIVGQFYSTDHGATWNGPVVIADDVSNGPNYYTSGSIYNPVGNSDIENMQGVYQGTILPNTGDWRFSMFGNSDLAGNMLTNYSFESTEADYQMYGYFNWQGLQQVGDEMRCINVYPLGAWNAFEELSLESIRAEFDGEEFDWENSEMVDFDLFYSESDAVVAWIGNWQGMDNGIDVAWSADGEIGYMWIVGVSNEDPTGYQPIVFRTENGGSDWDYVFLDFLEDEAQDYIYEYLIDVGGNSFVLPHIFETTGVVNAQGDLELITAMGSTSADVINYPDSIGYHWGYPGDLFNITVDGDGIKNIIWIDSLNTENVVSDSEGNYCGTDGWQHRLFATKSPDGNQMMFTWTDTRDAENNELNIAPDLFGWAKAINSDGDMATSEEVTCFTEGTLYETFYYFTSGSDYAYENEDGGYTVPYVQAVSPGEFASNTVSSADPVTVSYITGVEFPNLMPVGVEEFSAYNQLSVSQNQPNPFNGSTTIEISSNTVATASIEITNIMGQTVQTINAGTINGTQRVNIDASQLEAGVYFYTVTVANESVSKKMIVE